jgi:hypothetical protein
MHELAVVVDEPRHGPVHEVVANDHEDDRQDQGYGRFAQECSHRCHF